MPGLTSATIGGVGALDQLVGTSASAARSCLPLRQPAAVGVSPRPPARPLLAKAQCQDNEIRWLLRQW